MGSEIAQMKVRLSVYREKIFRLKKKWESHAETVRRGINPDLHDIGSVHMDELDIVWDQMKLIWAEVDQLEERAARLERTLG